MSTSDVTHAVDAVWRIEAPKLVAALTRVVSSFELAEELAQDALVAAMEQWPESGVPENPGAWLMAVAKRRGIDQVRRDKRYERKRQELLRELEVSGADVAPEVAPGDGIDDDMLRMIFMCCHPVLSTDARVALTLRVLGGLTTAEIARAFLTPESTIAQRIVRAKRTLTDKHVAFEVPQGDARSERLESVLEVVYLTFNEGYSATSGHDWTRPTLCEDAMRLGRMLARLAPTEPEVHGLVALLELQASRMRARHGPSGEPILLLEQDRTLWDRLLIERGLAALGRAQRLGGARGRYVLQAALAACHARATRAEETDWARIAALYEVLAEVAPSPVVELNRAVALGMAFGPQTGLDLVDALAADPAMRSYHLLPSVRGDLLAKLERTDEARAEFARAASLTSNSRERDVLLARARDG